MLLVRFIIINMSVAQSSGPDGIRFLLYVLTSSALNRMFLTKMKDEKYPICFADL